MEVHAPAGEPRPPFGDGAKSSRLFLTTRALFAECGGKRAFHGETEPRNGAKGGGNRQIYAAYQFGRVSSFRGEFDENT